MKTNLTKTINCSLSGAVCAGILTLASGASAQNLFVADYTGQAVYEYTPGGARTTFATGLNYPQGIAFNSAGDLFVANTAQNGPGGYISEILPDGTQSTFATGLDPIAVAVNSVGDVFAADYRAGNIDEYSPSGVFLSTFASGFSYPISMTFDHSGNLFVGSGYGDGNGVITSITPGGTQSTFATGLSFPIGLAFNSAGDLFESDDGSFNVNEFGPGGGTPTVFATLDNNANPLAFDSSGNLFVSDGYGGNIIEVANGGGQSTFATGLGDGSGMAFQPVPEPATLALLGIGLVAFFARWHLRKGCRRSLGGSICGGALLLTASGASAQNLFVSENISSGVIYEYSPAGVRSTFASTGLNYPYGMAFNSSGNLFVANNIDDAGVGGFVTEYGPGGTTTTIPSGPDPKGLAFDSSGNLFETDYHSGNIYKYPPGGSLSLFATVPAAPQVLAFNSAGDLFVNTGYGGGNEDITEITPQGVQSTFATGLSYVGGLAFNSAGNLFEADQSGNIYEYTPQGVRSTFASGLANLGNLAFDNQGNLFLAIGTGTIDEFTPGGTRSTFASGLNGPVGLAFQPVPEPTTLALLGIGAVAFFARRNLRKENARSITSTNSQV
jgi:sugar lactone lactonase YvrE